jgi:hypothetical protein
METTWIEIGGIVMRNPVSAVTNLVLAAQCMVYFLGLRRAASARQRFWGGFFVMMSVATLAGFFKHGFRHLLPEDLDAAVLAISNITGGVSTYFAQRGAVVSHAHRERRRLYGRVVAAQLIAFTLANLVFGPEIVLLIANTAVGLVPIIVIEAMNRGREPGAGLIAGGLSVSILTGVVYVLGISLGRWFNHIDIAHVLMGVSFLMVHRGVVRDGSWS